MWCVRDKGKVSWHRWSLFMDFDMMSPTSGGGGRGDGRQKGNRKRIFL